MTALLLGVLSALAGLVGAVLGDMLSEEVPRCLDRVPMQLIRLACRRLSEPVRTDRADEWAAELEVILARRGATRLPITRLVVGIRFALGLFIATPAIGRSARNRRLRQRGAIVCLAAAVVLPLLVAAIGAHLTALVADFLMVVVFARVLVRAIRFRDSQARFAALAFAPFAVLFVKHFAGTFGVLPSAVSIAAAVFLMFQPSLTLRFTQNIRPVTPAFKAVVGSVCAGAALVMALMPRPLPGAVLFLTVGSVALMQLATGSMIIFGSFRRLAADQRVKLMIAGMATALFGVAFLSFAVDAPSAMAANRVIAVVAAFGYLLLVAPPRSLHLPWGPKDSPSVA